MIKILEDLSKCHRIIISNLRNLNHCACTLFIIAERLSARHIIATLFSLSVYIYIYKCASRLGMLPVTPKTTNHTGYNRNHMCVGILKPFKHINTLQSFSA